MALTYPHIASRYLQYFHLNLASFLPKHFVLLMQIRVFTVLSGLYVVPRGVVLLAMLLP
jgi:hypothetical protein